MTRTTNLQLQTSSKRKSDEWWEWSVWVDGPDAELGELRSVIYHLHPTFPKPVIKVRDATTKFRLDSSGWGEFAIEAELEFKDGATHRLEKWLDLDTGGDPARTKSGWGEPASSGADAPFDVWLSYSLTDSPVAMQLKAELEKRRLRIVLPEEALSLGDSASSSVRKVMKNTNALVGLVSGTERDWMKLEIGAALQSKVPVFAVTLDEKGPSGPSEPGVHVIRKGSMNLQQLADTIVARLKNELIPDEE